MYAIAVNGSPRSGGNTELLLKEVLGELDTAGWDTELVKVGGTAIRGCIACQQCFKNIDNLCAVKSDNFNDIFTKMLRADAMILGSPTYFAAVSADSAPPPSTTGGFCGCPSLRELLRRASIS